MSFDQGEFAFDRPGDDTGYRRWHERLDEPRRAFEKRWGVPLDHPVRVQLRGHDRPEEIESVIREKQSAIPLQMSHPRG